MAPRSVWPAFPAGHPDSLGDAAVLGRVPEERPGAQAAMRGVNAAVVGILGAAALHDPVFATSVKTSPDLAVALVEFVLLMAWRAPPLVVVIVSAIGGIALGLVGA